MPGSRMGYRRERADSARRRATMLMMVVPDAWASQRRPIRRIELVADSLVAVGGFIPNLDR